jgi:hypothetical protein
MAVERKSKARWRPTGAQSLIQSSGTGRTEVWPGLVADGDGLVGGNGESEGRQGKRAPVNM